MSSSSVVVLAVIWLVMLKALTSESVLDSSRHRHTFKRRQLHREKQFNGDVRFRRDDMSRQPFSMFVDEDAAEEIVDDILELDKPRECFLFENYCIRSNIDKLIQNIYYV